ERWSIGNPPVAPFGWRTRLRLGRPLDRPDEPHSWPRSRASHRHLELAIVSFLSSLREKESPLCRDTSGYARPSGAQTTPPGQVLLNEVISKPPAHRRRRSTCAQLVGSCADTPLLPQRKNLLRAKRRRRTAAGRGYSSVGTASGL